MSLENKVLRLMREDDYVPSSLLGISKQLKLNEKEQKRLRNTLHNLIKEGTIARVKDDRYCVAKDADLIGGQIKFRQNGSALLIPDAPEDAPRGRVIHIRAEDTFVALHDDHVLVRLKPHRPRTRFKRGRRIAVDAQDDRIYGKVIRILKRAHSQITGTLKSTRMFHHVIPDDPRFNRNVLVQDPSRCKIKPRPKLNDKVVVKLLKWTQPHLNPEGEILKTLGKTHTPDAEFEAILHKYNLDPQFPDAVMNEVVAYGDKVSEKDCTHRLDYREVFTFTIDPDDAKDFDDALSIETLDDGSYRIGIHIADVSHYVKPGSQLDREATRRGNSTYLVGCVIPMLPHQLSNGLCSLVEGEDRLTKSVFITFASNGQVKDTQFANTVICSNKRLTYKQAYAFLFEDDLDKVIQTPLPPSHQTGATGRSLKELKQSELQRLQSDIRQLWAIASRIRKSRFKKGALEFDMPEIKIFVDKGGYADRIERIFNDESHQLIEEFMLLANDNVAKNLFDAGMAYISRVHDKPDEDKLNELRDALLTSGVECGDLTQRREIVRVLAQLKDHSEGYRLKIEFLRSLKQACYRAEADGHYGLYKKFYAHFTSPIRRYADLINHRIVDQHLQKQNLPTAPSDLSTRYTKNKLNSLAQHVSITEQKSTEAERESNKIKLLEFYERETKKEEKTPFQAIIVDVKNNGVFVELTDSQAFGLVSMSTLKDDLYRLSSDRRSIIGRRRQRRYSVGQNINVIVQKVDRFRRQIDFRIAREQDEHPLDDV